MIQTVPLPTWRQLLSLPKGGSRIDAQPDRWLTDPGDTALWLSRSAWSLALLARAMMVERGRTIRVAVPEYICNQSLWPLRQTGAELDFYALDPQRLTPLWPDDGQGAPPDLVLLVHYFAWANAGDEALAYCRRHDALLVEDCAHVLRPTPEIGRLGDVVLYSQHKVLACPDGALCLLRRQATALGPAMRADLNAMASDHPPVTAWAWRRMVQKTPIAGLRARLRPPGQSDFTADPSTTPMPCQPRASAAALSLIDAADLELVARRRRVNAAALLEVVGTVPGLRPLFDRILAEAPYRLPLLCANQQQAERLFQACRAERLPAESWPDLPPEITSGTATMLRSRVLLLPCHQDLQPAQLQQAFTRVLRRLSV